MECSIFLVLQMEATWIKKVCEEHLSPFFSLKLQELKIFWTPIVLNQNKSSSVFFLIVNFSSFIGALYPKPGQQSFWVSSLHAEMCNIL